MGGDISVCQEGELEEEFWKYHGSNDESLSDLFKRTVRGNSPEARRFRDYRINDAHGPYALPSTHFRGEEYTVVSRACAGKASKSDASSSSSSSSGSSKGGAGSGPPVALNCVHWTHTGPGRRPGLAVLYLHTNTRALIDAIEVMPLCEALQCDLAAVDLPGCGRSGGTMHLDMHLDVAAVMDHLRTRRGVTQVVLWARGMGTSVAIDFASCVLCPELTYLVLDSPFVSSKRIMAEVVSKVRAKGYFLPDTVVDLSAYVGRKYLKKHYGGVDPMHLKPMERLKKHGAALSELPCHVIAAESDDYISADQGREMAEAYPGQCSYSTVSGGHFGPRPRQAVLSLRHRIMARLNIRDDEGFATGIDSSNEGAIGGGGGDAEGVGVGSCGVSTEGEGGGRAEGHSEGTAALGPQLWCGEAGGETKEGML